MRRLRFFVDRLFRRGRLDRQLDDEIRFHIAERAAHLQRGGMTGEAAMRRARLEFGGVEKFKEASRDTRHFRWVHDGLTDLRYGSRALRKNPAFTAAAVLTLALGIGANTAMFSLVSWLVLRPLPVEQPDGLAYLAFPQRGSHVDTHFAMDEYRQIRRTAGGVFEDVATFTFGGAIGGLRGIDGLTADGATQPVQAVFVSGNFFSLLGIQPQRGRFLLPLEGSVSGADPVVVISDRYWQSRFGRDPSVIGKQVAINGQSLTVVGVAPTGFYGVTPLVDMQAYLPLSMATVEGSTATRWFSDAKTRRFIVFGRVQPGVSLAQAEGALAGVGAQLARARDRENAGARLLVRALRPPGLISGPNPLPRLAVLFLTLAGLVLLLAGINVTNLLLVRAGVRQHEMSVRAAIGAARGRLVRQMLAESLLLATLGCAAGMAVGITCIRLLMGIPLETEFPLVLDIRFDWRVFVYAAAASALTGMLVGLVPALRAAHGSPAQALREGGRTTSGTRQRWRSLLAISQIGGSLALLIAAALLTRSLAAVRAQDFGFDPRGALNLKISPRQIGLSEKQGTAFYRELLERVRALPGVESASLASSIPLGDDTAEVPVVVPGYDLPKTEQAPTPVYTVISTGHLSTMRMRLLKGRDFANTDTDNTPGVAMVNQQMADHFWPGQDAIGRHFALAENPNQSLQVIGIVNNSRTTDVDGPISLAFYVPAAQHYMHSANLQVRTRARPETMLPDISRIVHSIQPTMPMYGIRTVEQSLNGINGLQVYTLGAALAAAMGLVGLLLAIVGVYGVISYSVLHRRQEIGIRVALGARRAEVVSMIFAQGLVIVCAGVVSGLAAAFALTRLLSGFLTGVSVTDPYTYVGVSACLTVMAMLAGYIPARRATRIDPMIALRGD